MIVTVGRAPASANSSLLRVSVPSGAKEHTSAPRCQYGADRITPAYRGPDLTTLAPLLRSAVCRSGARGALAPSLRASFMLSLARAPWRTSSAPTTTVWEPRRAARGD